MDHFCFARTNTHTHIFIAAKSTWTHSPWAKLNLKCCALSFADPTVPWVPSPRTLPAVRWRSVVRRGERDVLWGPTVGFGKLRCHDCVVVSTFLKILITFLRKWSNWTKYFFRWVAQLPTIDECFFFWNGETSKHWQALRHGSFGSIFHSEAWRDLMKFCDPKWVEFNRDPYNLGGGN